MNAPRANRLAGLLLDRAEDRRADPAWLRDRWAAAEVLLLDPSGDALADQHGAPKRIRAAVLPEQIFSRACFLGLGTDGAALFTVSLEAGEHCPLEQPPRWVGLRRAAASWPEFDSALFAYARALALWRARCRYCGSCGAATVLARGGHTQRCSAPDCAQEHFPRLDPAIIVLVTDGDRCLLGRQAGWPERQYSTLAGFVEPGESLEDAVRREVAEEAGVTLRDCRYQSSQPWPFPSSLMIGFRAEAQDPAIRLGDELEDARWFGIDALLEALSGGELLPSSSISISHRLLREWLLELRGADAVATLEAATRERG